MNESSFIYVSAYNETRFESKEQTMSEVFSLCFLCLRQSQSPKHKGREAKTQRAQKGVRHDGPDGWELFVSIPGIEEAEISEECRDNYPGRDIQPDRGA